MRTYLAGPNDVGTNGDDTYAKALLHVWSPPKRAAATNLRVWARAQAVDPV
ncbi:hypothetical protein ACFW1F_25965 [Streptomyces bungoensis]|uniref:hypothetical protein n=1 Tax=Streptomyces bungoensis TaxID=285568 RepID=UPI0036CCED9C